MVNISNLVFSYKKTQYLFDNFNLSLTCGNIYGLLGKNGAGKTTLLKIISGLLFPLKGECTLNGIKTMGRQPEVLNQVMFLPEISYLPNLKLNEFLEIHASFFGKFDKPRFLRFLNDFEVEVKGKIMDLSFGQKKKFSLAFALAANTNILLLDEPTNGLDIPAKSVFRKLVAECINEDKLFLISTHQVKDMKHLIDPILILDNGKIIFNSNIKQIEEKLSVTLQREEPANEVIYFENTLGGYALLEENKYGSEDDVDIELLFNAVISNKETILKIFNGEKV